MDQADRSGDREQLGGIGMGISAWKAVWATIHQQDCCTTPEILLRTVDEVAHRRERDDTTDRGCRAVPRRARRKPPP